MREFFNEAFRNFNHSRCECKAGQIANYERTECLPCAPGSFTSEDGHFCTNILCNKKKCPKCPKGHICPGSGTVSPVICKVGTISNYERTECLPCAPGSFTSEDGQFCDHHFCKNCPKCPNGHICPGFGSSRPIKCLETKSCTNNVLKTLMNKQLYICRHFISFYVIYLKNSI